jgi:hypothetical protein
MECVVWKDNIDARHCCTADREESGGVCRISIEVNSQVRCVRRAIIKYQSKPIERHIPSTKQFYELHGVAPFWAESISLIRTAGVGVGVGVKVGLGVGVGVGQPVVVMATSSIFQDDTIKAPPLPTRIPNRTWRAAF